MNAEACAVAAEELHLQAARVATVQEIYETNRKLSELWGRRIRADGQDVDTSSLEEEFRRNQEELDRLQAEVDARCRAFRILIGSAGDE